MRRQTAGVAFRVCRLPELRRAPTSSEGARTLSVREGGRDPREVPVVLRGARPPAHAVSVARAVVVRPFGVADDGRYAAVEALLPRRGKAAESAAHVMSEVLPD